MIRKICCLVALVFSLSLAYAAERLLPAEYSGSMMPYDFSVESDAAIWPDSLKPVYVARVARHGARYISSAKKLDALRAALDHASATGTITREGRRFAGLLKKVAQTTGNRWGLLSDIGIEEERRLADDLYSLLPDLLEKARIRSISTYVPRVVMTMYEFNHQLAIRSSRLSISAAEGREFSPLLRCFTTDSAYAAYRESGNWKQVSDRMLDSIVSPLPALRLLGKNCGLSDARLKKLTLDIYDVLQSLTAFGMQAPDEEYMEESQYRACWEVDNLEHYLRNTVTPLSQLAGQATAPLLGQIISDADASLSARLMSGLARTAGMKTQEESNVRNDATFYFGHAETLMPLLSLMRVPGCYSDSSDLVTLSERWKDYEVVPLGANLDIIFLQSPHLATYVALRHNGRFVSPMPGTDRKIVEWTRYRQFLTDILSSYISNSRK